MVHRIIVSSPKGFGVREAGKTDPVTADKVFQLALMSKSIASTVAAALVGDYTVTWDTRVSQEGRASA